MPSTSSIQLNSAVTRCTPAPYPACRVWRNLFEPEIWAPMLVVSLGTSVTAIFTGSPGFMVFSMLAPFLFYATSHAAYALFDAAVRRGLLPHLSGRTSLDVPSLPFVIIGALTVALFGELVQTEFTFIGTDPIWLVLLLTLVMAIGGELFMVYLMIIALPMIAKRRAAQAPPPSDPPPVAQHFQTIHGHVIDRRKLLMLAAEGNYVAIVECDRRTLVPGPLFKVLEHFEGIDGIQVHRSFWVANTACKSVLRKSGEVYLIVSNEDRIKIARTRRRDVLAALALLRVPGASLNG